MGEKVKDLSTFGIGNNSFSIEYNKGWSEGTIDIHIQSGDFRWSLSDEEMMKLFVCTLKAKRYLSSMKEDTPHS